MSGVGTVPWSGTGPAWEITGLTDHPVALRATSCSFDNAVTLQDANAAFALTEALILSNQILDSSLRLWLLPLSQIKEFKM